MRPAAGGALGHARVPDTRVLALGASDMCTATSRNALVVVVSYEHKCPFP